MKHFLSRFLVVLALKGLPLGTAYAIWTGFGIVGTSLLGMWLFGERLSAMQCACVALIVIGIAGLKLLGKQ